MTARSVYGKLAGYVIKILMVFVTSSPLFAGKEEDARLCAAANSGDMDLAGEALLAKANVEAPCVLKTRFDAETKDTDSKHSGESDEPKPETALQVATFLGHSGVADVLIMAGAAIDDISIFMLFNRVNKYDDAAAKATQAWPKKHIAIHAKPYRALLTKIFFRFIYAHRSDKVAYMIELGQDVNARGSAKFPDGKVYYFSALDLAAGLGGLICPDEKIRALLAAAPRS